MGAERGEQLDVRGGAVAGEQVAEHAGEAGVPCAERLPARRACHGPADHLHERRPRGAQRLRRSLLRRGLGSIARVARKRILAAAVLVSTSTIGCASTTLLDEEKVAPFAALLRADRALSSTVLRFGDERSESAGLVYVREVQSGSPAAAARPVLVLLNGVFSDGDTWRFDTSLLAEQHDLLVIDLPGTGRSTGSEPDAQPESQYTLEWVASRTWRTVAGWQALQVSPRPLVLVGHSVGGAVVLRMLGQPRLRERFAPQRAHVVGSVLIGAADVGTPGWSPTLIELAKLSEVEVALGDALGVLDARARDGIAKSVEDPTKSALEHEAERMVAALVDRDRRRASQLMLRRIRPVDGADVPEWGAVREMVEDHGRVDVPTLLVWGRDDDTLTLDTAKKLEREIPGARLAIIEDARHSVQQEQPFATTRAVLEFVEGLRGSAR